jgi:elongation factor Ts
MTITAKEVSELRKSTGCGMMDCKKALLEAEGNMDTAAEILRKKGIAQAANKASRIAAEGVIKIEISQDGKQAIMVEVNCETDFVARDDNFNKFVNLVAEQALLNRLNEIEALMGLTIGDKTIEQIRQELTAKIGENINVRRIAFIEISGIVGAYTHGNRIGVLAALSKGDSELAKDVAMHIAAAKPLVVSADRVPEKILAKEREIYGAQAAESGKPQNIVDKIVEGRIKKYLNEVTLLGQTFVKNPDITVGQLLKDQNAEVDVFIRFELGEGIEKRADNFVEEVKAQVEASK